MDLIIGGFVQGKMKVAQERYQNAEIVDEKNHEMLKQIAENVCESAQQPLLVNHFHLICRMWLLQGMSRSQIEAILEDLIHACQSAGKPLCIITDEIGCGIVPMDKTERMIREETGRCQCFLASCAERVDRVLCGIAMRIK